MSTRTSRWPAGVPCWADLLVPDRDAAVRFYGAVLGWEPVGDVVGGHQVVGRRDLAAAAIGTLPVEGQPAAWLLHLAADDAASTAALVEQHGGRVVLPAGEVGDAGVMAVCEDPTGARFALWEAASFTGAQIVNEPGGLVWEDLRSTDPVAARDFYGALLGYRFEDVPMAGPDYWTFALPGEQPPLGGIGGTMGAPAGTPSHWLVYWQVEDADAAAASTREHGGSVLAEPFDTPFGRMTGLADPFGAVFWAMTAEDGPDRSG